ncbi:RteC domain-containing protein [Marinifilum flexuosum]|uniref:RteC domain-containing protein n=1 Tax=Marinifilum flexuosum TaxID=1117708 RepID=UPI002493EC5F|nr:RteC domain-containing protein [Marinifilum flexuosum]
MIIEKSFLLLKEELSKMVVEFEKDDSNYKIYFNDHSSVSEYNLFFNRLQLDFVSELKNNLSSMKSDGEIQMYLLTTRRIFELTKVTLQSATETNYSGLNIRMISKVNNDITCVNTGPDEFMCVNEYLQCQYQTVQDVISIINECSDNSSKSGKKKSSKKQKLEKDSWQDDIKEYYPMTMKMKDDLHNITSLKEKLDHVEKEKEGLELVFKSKGKDFYTSALSLLFRGRIDAYRELLISEDIKDDHSSSQLVWNKSKTDFLELMSALHLSKAIGLKNRDSLSRKDQIEIFEKLLNIGPIPDSDSRISKLHVRDEPCSFLKKLQNAIIRYLTQK